MWEEERLNHVMNSGLLGKKTENKKESVSESVSHSDASCDVARRPGNFQQSFPVIVSLPPSSLSPISTLGLRRGAVLSVTPPAAVS